MCPASARRSPSRTAATKAASTRTWAASLACAPCSQTPTTVRCNPLSIPHPEQCLACLHALSHLDITIYLPLLWPEHAHVEGRIEGEKDELVGVAALNVP